MDLLLDPERPVQIVVAGKAHPADDGGKRLVQELVRFADDPRVRHRVVFLPDYGMAMARKLYPGCDVWLNNPLRPLEACGTSGMKAALNGCLNLSVLDGWWDEWFDPDFGWAIPTADGLAADENRRDDLEANALYELIEDRVAPRFYDRGPDGLPGRWIEMVRSTLVTLGPKVLAGRMVREYVERLYAPARPRPPRPGRRYGDGAGGLEVPDAHALAVCVGRPRGGGGGERYGRRGRTGLHTHPAGERRPRRTPPGRCGSAGGRGPGRLGRRDRGRGDLPAQVGPAGRIWRAAGCTRARWPWTVRARTATRYGCCPRTRCSLGVDLGLVALPTEMTGEGAGVLMR